MAELVYSHAGIDLWLGDCREVLPRLPDESIDAIVTSPPYALQRASFYGGVPEHLYPAWTVGWLTLLRPALRSQGSVLLNIREHVQDGQISDYVHRTRLAVREAGWCECDELIWIKDASPPVGAIARPRRSWERILWFSLSSRPWCDTKANGHQSSRIGMQARQHSTWVAGSRSEHDGIARSPDYVVMPVGEPTGGRTEHPAAYPVRLAEWCIKLVVPPGGMVVDPFVGSGSTLIAAKRLGCRAVGVELERRYIDVAIKRLAQEVMPLEEVSRGT